ncbi:acyclic terpene utilization AtuA family protein [Orrella sp. 11846]|uniref:acyclic terpene utilization AtuA family protein n=1 Tax=Orrella sp. 11846 TaxID=3409913 RepID=UPI003B594AD7
MKHSILIGCGAGFSGDRVDAALPVVQTLVHRGGPAALIFENLAERTLAINHLARQNNPNLGYEPLLELELRPILALCLQHNITIVSNFGAANPQAAARKIFELAFELGLTPPKIAVVTGDDLSDAQGQSLLTQTLGGSLQSKRFVCANVYQGAQAIAQAISAGAQIVVTGRVADPSLVLGPAMAHYGWAEDDWDKLAGASMAGHLLECGSQVTGGYFADPGHKDVPGMDQIGFPIAEIFEDGTCILTKADHTGGLLNRQTVIEQLLYEVHDPAAYITPDVVADITQAQVTEIAPNIVQLTGVRGHPRTNTLKVNAFFDGGWFGEGEISYSGPNALARAQLARDTLSKRLSPQLSLRFDLIGVCSLFNDDDSTLLSQKEAQLTNVTPFSGPQDVRLRVAAKHDDVSAIDALLREVNALWTCGPAGGGGVRVHKRPRLSLVSCLLSRDQLPQSFEIL